MRGPELVGREPAPDARLRGQRTQFVSGGGGGPAAAPRAPVDDAEQRSGRQQDAVGEPGVKLLKALVMRQAGHHRHGLRIRALIAVLWRGGLPISEAGAQRDRR
jgi:hypothetical protein